MHLSRNAELIKYTAPIFNLWEIWSYAGVYNRFLYATPINFSAEASLLLHTRTVHTTCQLIDANTINMVLWYVSQLIH